MPRPLQEKVIRVVPTAPRNGHELGVGEDAAFEVTAKRTFDMGG